MMYDQCLDFFLIFGFLFGADLLGGGAHYAWGGALFLFFERIMPGVERFFYFRSALCLGGALFLFSERIMPGWSAFSIFGAQYAWVERFFYFRSALCLGGALFLFSERIMPGWSALAWDWSAFLLFGAVILEDGAALYGRSLTFLTFRIKI
ncbi:hypothetical protein [Oceanobacillus sp. J11TS1]|uniref:hypothetical protein n=1 Tax=Oceanobacillus sp. J11TS1 TaxID=2807191 RepID=UPI001BB44035|nr:hypothetical protein [Oceanobacillus sp. J11TS1]